MASYMKAAQEAATRDLDYLKLKFFQEVGFDTNDILTLFSFWQCNYSQPGSMIGISQT